MKRLMQLLVLSIMILSISLSAGAVSSTKSKTNSEFGTLTGYQDYVGKKLGRKNINFEVSTTKTASKLIASVEIINYLTGAHLDGDIAQKSNATWCGYTCECHSNIANSNSITSYGTHEARGTGSLVVYTTLTNLN